MGIRWRLAALVVQLAVLLAASWVMTGSPIAGEIWFASGLLAIVVNPQLLEPFYPKPQDVVGNCLFGLILIWFSENHSAPALWSALAVFLAAGAVLALVALALGAGRHTGKGTRLARAAMIASQPFTSRAIYSALFWLGLLDVFPVRSRSFWVGAVAWAILTLLGKINWQTVWAATGGTVVHGTIVGIVGPSRALLSAPSIPRVGSTIRITSRVGEHEAVVLRRIPRAGDIWADVHLVDPTASDQLASIDRVELMEVAAAEEANIVGSVDRGSTDARLVFTSPHVLSVGEAVAVAEPVGPPVIYQLISAEVEQSDVAGGAYLTTRVLANQIGAFNSGSQRLESRRWTPTPGATVRTPYAPAALGEPPDGYFRLGEVLGTEIPVFLDLHAACEGHLAVLGMTRMGKTTLCLRLASGMSGKRRVVFLDQTGEYTKKLGVNAVDPENPWAEGIHVLEPGPNQDGPQFALGFLTKTLSTAAEEYAEGDPNPRTLLLDEAHQFVPEPSGLGFGVPGREESVAFGARVMQVRKFGISIVLISQRTAVVAKSALSQCENLIAFKSVDQTGLDYLEAIGGPGMRALLPKLRQGEAIVTGPAFSSDGPVVVRLDEA